MALAVKRYAVIARLDRPHHQRLPRRAIEHKKIGRAIAVAHCSRKDMMTGTIHLHISSTIAQMCTPTYLPAERIKANNLPRPFIGYIEHMRARIDSQRFRSIARM